MPPRIPTTLSVLSWRNGEGVGLKVGENEGAPRFSVGSDDRRGKDGWDDGLGSGEKGLGGVLIVEVGGPNKAPWPKEGTLVEVTALFGLGGAIGPGAEVDGARDPKAFDAPEDEPNAFPDVEDANGDGAVADAANTFDGELEGAPNADFV